MDIVTTAGTGRHVASWRSSTAAPSGATAGEQDWGQQLDQPVRRRPRVRQRDLGTFPTPDPQRASAPRRWGP